MARIAAQEHPVRRLPNSPAVKFDRLSWLDALALDIEVLCIVQPMAQDVGRFSIESPCGNFNTAR
jgi:hypothetical protein